MKKLLLFGLLLCLFQTKAQFCFTPPQVYGNGSSTSNTIRNADIDKNGMPDFVVVKDTQSYDGRIVVYMNYNAGTQTFASTSTYALPTGGGPTDIAVADFNGDSIKDIVVANYHINFLSVLPGNGTAGIGDGTFNAPITFNVGGYPASMAIADFNGDTKPDIAVVNNGSTFISVLANTSTVTSAFTFATNTVNVGNGYTQIIAGNFDGGSGMDFAALNSAGSLITFLNNGVGVFAPTSTLTAGSGANGITVGDYNGDGNTDLATVGSSNNYISVFMSLGGGNFSAANNYNAGVGASSLWGITSGDFDLDGKLDIAVLGYNISSGLFVLPGAGNGSFNAASTFNFSTNSNASSLIRGDYNGDGILDLAFVIGGTNPANILINAKPIINGPSAICLGGSTVLNASGANTYQWSANAGSATTNTVSVSPTINTTYTVTGTSGGCSASSVRTLSVNATPTISAVASPTAICSGASTATITASGASTYTWNTSATTASITAAPPSTSTYTVSGTNALGCVATKTISLVVNASPIAGATTSNPICVGGTLNFINTSSGATSYSWTGPNAFSSNLANPTIVSVTPINTGNYVLTASTTAGCSSTYTVNVVVNSLPSIIISGTSTICTGNTTTLTASGATTYTWSTTANTNAITVSPGSTTAYTVTGTATGCTNTATKTITVNALPIINVAATPSVICLGASSTITASGAVSYTWSPNTNLDNAIGASAVATPTTSVNYIASGTDANGCTNNSNPLSVGVNAVPVITVTATTGASCFGTCDGQAAISISGVGGPLSILPATWTLNGYAATGIGLCSGTQSVTVTGGNGCPATQTLTITQPSAALSVSVTPSTSTFCAGASANYATSVSGGTAAYTYSWSPSSDLSTSTSPNTVASPTSTTTYTLLVTDANNCTQSAVSTLTVNPLPNIGMGGVITICNGNSTTLNATGASTYTWNTGANTTTITVSPSSSTTYSVNGTDANGCTNFATSFITVNATPVITVTATTAASCFAMCNGQSDISISGVGGPLSILPANWTLNGYAATGTGLCAGTQSVTVTGGNGCPATQTLTINEPSAITVTLTPSATTCGLANGTIAGSVSGGTSIYTFSWTPLGGTVTSTTNSSNYYNLSAGTYTLNVTDANNCTAISSATVNASTNTASVTINEVSPMVCIGSSIALTTSGNATTYTWSTAATTSSITVSPTSNTTYTVTGADATNCTAMAITTVTVNILPNIGAVTSPTVVCPAGSSTLSANGATSYTWNPSGLTGAFVGVNTSTTTDYTVIGEDINGCISTATVNVAVNAFDDLSGTIYDTTLSTPHTITNGVVYLYTQQNGTTAIDTTNLLANGVFATINSANGSYSFSQVAAGNYYLKAVADTHFYHGAIPTYLSTGVTPAYRWDSAAVVTHVGCNNGNDTGHDITMIELPAQTGTGVISGTITANATFGQRYSNGGGWHNQPMGAPLKGIDVKLGKNPGGGCAARTSADTSGAYQFTGVDTGSYYIYVDIPNFGMVTILTATITPANPVSTNNNYCVDSTNIGLCTQGVGIKQVAGNTYQVNVYPNPNNGIVNLQMNDYENASVEVYSVIGQKVLSHVMQNNLQQINLSSLTDGVYQIRVLKNNSSVYQTKIIKQ